MGEIVTSEGSAARVVAEQPLKLVLFLWRSPAHYLLVLHQHAVLHSKASCRARIDLNWENKTCNILCTHDTIFKGRRMSRQAPSSGHINYGGAKRKADEGAAGGGIMEEKL